MPPPPPPQSWPSTSTSLADPAPSPPPMPPGGFPSAPDTDNAGKLRFMRAIAATKSNTPSIPFQPCHMFFYGSLMDPAVIEVIPYLSEIPITRPATISDFRIKMWRIYLALVPVKSGEVVGCVWELTSEGHFDRLAAYETAAYTCVECEAVLEDGALLKRCRTFCWAGDPNSKQLEDGTFDLERYQRQFKPSVMRQRSFPLF